MSNTIFITANWTTGALSQQTISRQYDNNRYAVQFIGYPEGDGTEELDLYLLVWMSTAPGQKPGEITPIQLNSDQWYISNYFTQQVQVIKFQLCVLNEAGTYEAHSPIFSGRIGDSLEHNGTSHDIDVSTLFDAYREYLNELIIGAGAVIIDPVPTQGSNNAVSGGGVYSALAGKVDAETGKGLSTNDYSDAEKQKVTDANAGLTAMTTATAEDVGKVLKAKTVTNGKVTEWEFGETGDVEQIDSLNEQMAMLITKSEKPKPVPTEITQVCDLSGASVAGSGTELYWSKVKINLPWLGTYYFNPSEANLQLVYGRLYNKNGESLTLYRGSSVYSNGIATVNGAHLEMVDKRTIKEYRANGTLVNTWTTDDDIAYINGNTRICYFSDPNFKAGITYGGESQTYIEYGDSSSDESDTEYEYTISDDVGDFAHDYTLENYTDSEPTDGSTNIVTSGGIKTALGKQFENSCNLIDESKFDFTSTGYWNLESGYYFPVTAGKKICASVAKPTFTFFDSEKVSISTERPTVAYSLVDIPEGAVWARMSINATANTLSKIQGKIMVYESDAATNDDRRDYVPPTKIIGNLVEGDIYNTAKPLSLDIDILTASQYRAVRALNHQRNAFRIGTFNIYVTRGSAHWGVLKQELKDYSLDICAMQEVNNTLDSRYVQNFLTMNTWQFKYGSQAVFNDTLADKAVVSVYEIVSTELYNTSTNRPYTKTVINLPQYKRNAHQFTLSVYSAHLNLTASNRLVEASEILATVANDTSDFIVICMDSNTFKSEMDAQGKLPTWEAFISAGFTPIHYGEYSTVTDMTDTSKSLDQIFMGANITCADYDIVNSNDYPVTISGQELPISDHCMVYADLIFDFDAVLAILNT